jgi:hypothetical protein
MSDFIGFGVNDEVLSRGDLEYYRGKQGIVDRIALCWLNRDADGKPLISDFRDPDPKITPRFKLEMHHYVQGLGYIKPVDPYTTEKFGPPKTMITTFIVKYATDRLGQIHGDLDISKVSVHPWKVSPDKFNRMKVMHGEFNLTCTDIKVSCKEEKFQNMDMTQCNGLALWIKDPEIRKFVLKQVEQMERKLKGVRELTVAEIKEKLGESEVAVPATADASNFDDLMDTLG